MQRPHTTKGNSINVFRQVRENQQAAQEQLGVSEQPQSNIHPSPNVEDVQQRVTFNTNKEQEALAAKELPNNQANQDHRTNEVKATPRIAPVEPQQPRIVQNKSALNFYSTNGAENVDLGEQEAPNTVTLDLQDLEPKKGLSRYNTNDDSYTVSALNDAFERHLQRQEMERHKRYVTNFRNDMRSSNGYQTIETEKEKYMDLSNLNTNGVTIEFSGDPMLEVHRKRSKARDQMTSR